MEQFAQSYWGVIGFVVVAIVFAIFNRKIAINIAKTKAHQLILFIEKEAEEFLVENGEAKKQWVVSKYVWLPSYIKLFVSVELYEKLVQYAYDQAMEYAVKNLK